MTPKDDWLGVWLDNIQPTGASTILQVHVGNTRLTILQPGFIRMKAGAQLWIDFDAETLSLFDSDSRNNLLAA